MAILHFDVGGDGLGDSDERMEFIYRRSCGYRYCLQLRFERIAVWIDLLCQQPILLFERTIAMCREWRWW